MATALWHNSAGLGSSRHIASEVASTAGSNVEAVSSVEMKSAIDLHSRLVLALEAGVHEIAQGLASNEYAHLQPQLGIGGNYAGTAMRSCNQHVGFYSNAQLIGNLFHMVVQLALFPKPRSLDRDAQCDDFESFPAKLRTTTAETVLVDSDGSAEGSHQTASEYPISRGPSSARPADFSMSPQSYHSPSVNGARRLDSASSPQISCESRGGGEGAILNGVVITMKSSSSSPVPPRSPTMSSVRVPSPTRVAVPFVKVSGEGRPTEKAASEGTRPSSSFAGEPLVDVPTLLERRTSTSRLHTCGLRTQNDNGTFGNVHVDQPFTHVLANQGNGCSDVTETPMSTVGRHAVGVAAGFADDQHMYVWVDTPHPRAGRSRARSPNRKLNG